MKPRVRALILAVLVAGSTATMGGSLALDGNTTLAAREMARGETVVEIDRDQIVLERLAEGRATLRLLVEPLDRYEIALRERPSPFASDGNWWKIISRDGTTVSSGTFDFASFDADEGSAATYAYVALGADFVHGVIDLPEYRINIGPRPSEDGALVQTLKIESR